MKGMTPQAIATAIGGRCLRPGAGPLVTRVSTDTRNSPAGALFFALSGPRFDAHDFLLTAVARGAAGLVVSDASRLPEPLADHVAVIEVSDALDALTQLAAHVRRTHPGRFVAITGSVGKTTVKDMAAAALGAFGVVGATPGNWNNHVGLPLTLCGLTGDEAFVVLELGMSAPGEIGALTRLAQPHVGLVTRASEAHLEFFTSVEAIADAKAELYVALPEGAVSVANADDPRMLSRARTLRP